MKEKSVSRHRGLKVTYLYFEWIPVSNPTTGHKIHLMPDVVKESMYFKIITFKYIRKCCFFFFFQNLAVASQNLSECLV